MRPPVPSSSAKRKAALTVEWLPTALVAGENGLPVVNIGQVFARPSLRLACRADSGVTEAAHLRGKTVANWFSGSELALSGWLNRAGIESDAVTLIPQGNGAEMLRQRQADCVSLRSYAALPDGAILLDPASLDAATLEDGLYALDATLKDPVRRAQIAAFLRASLEGWRMATAQPEASARLLLGSDPDEGALQRLTAALQAIGGILGDGLLAPSDYRGTITTLHAGGAAAVLKDRPGHVSRSQISGLPPAAPAPDAGQMTVRPAP